MKAKEPKQEPVASSICPECGCEDWSHIETHQGLIECDRCGHPREANEDDMNRSLTSMGYDPQALVKKIIKCLKDAGIQVKRTASKQK